MIIRTGRLTLLPLEAAHAQEMATVLGDPELHRYVGGAPLTEPELRTRYARLAAGSPDPAVTWWNWVVRLDGAGRLVGTVQATVSGGVAEVAWVIGTPWQRRGIAAEAAAGPVGWLRTQAAVHAVIAHVHPDHTASAAVARASGLTPTDQRHDGEVRWEHPERQ
ncbi:GNAT family N-acetyltransferase [Streptomyces sp. NBC_01264]|uniref:GNAT family N-acetyltransferase n=1 Tax=Streptomyces sp. NBC_01264 TaxID=2903804 RepID=UPI002258DF1D|nr:GNAT family N-acetyltransferase [Streptomyces sp. NBC_01264]MCX4779751.1 GNAT family N-acetyltransferase [Streptomyces sp. NBC_01264]